MQFDTLLERAKELFEKEEKQRGTARVRRVMTFFVEIGLLDTNWLKPLKANVLKIEDVLWVAKNIEPRVLEVFPAALIHYPKSFLGLDKLPLELRKIIDNIRLGRAVDGMYKGIEIKKMAFWANFQLPDKRTKPLNEQRVMKTFRFKPTTVLKIKQAAAKKGVSETALLESLVQATE